MPHGEETPQGVQCEPMNSASFASASFASAAAPGADCQTAPRAGGAALTPWPVALRGVAIDPLSPALAIERVAVLATAKRPAFAVFADAALIVGAETEPATQRALLEADLIVPTSRIVARAAQLCGRPFPPVATADGLLAASVAIAAARGIRIFLLGFEPAVVTALERTYPVLQVVGSEPSGSSRWPTEPSLAERIRHSGARLVLAATADGAALGWLASHRRQLGATVCAWPASSLRQLQPTAAAAADRATRAWRALHRAGQAVVTRGRWLGGLVVNSWRLRPRPAKAPARPAAFTASLDWLQIDAGSSLTAAALTTHGELWHGVLQSPTHWALDLSHVEVVDAAGLGFLVRARHVLRDADRQLVLIAPSASVRRALAVSRLGAVFLVAPAADEALRWVDARPPSPPAPEARALAWCGEIMAANVHDVWQMTIDHVRNFVGTGATLVVIDLARLRGIDTAGAALMLRVKQWARTRRAEILFAHPSAQIREILRRAEVDLLVLEGAQ
jgi:anti-anti-sigma factor